MNVSVEPCITNPFLGISLDKKKSRFIVLLLIFHFRWRASQEFNSTLLTLIDRPEELENIASDCSISSVP
jgi:hypothetical protein